MRAGKCAKLGLMPVSHMLVHHIYIYIYIYIEYREGRLSSKQDGAWDDCCPKETDTRDDHRPKETDTRNDHRLKKLTQVTIIV